MSAWAPEARRVRLSAGVNGNEKTLEIGSGYAQGSKDGRVSLPTGIEQPGNRDAMCLS